MSRASARFPCGRIAAGSSPARCKCQVLQLRPSVTHLDRPCTVATRSTSNIQLYSLSITGALLPYQYVRSYRGWRPGPRRTRRPSDRPRGLSTLAHGMSMVRAHVTSHFKPRLDRRALGASSTPMALRAGRSRAGGDKSVTVTQAPSSTATAIDEDAHTGAQGAPGASLADVRLAVGRDLLACWKAWTSRTAEKAMPHGTA